MEISKLALLLTVACFSNCLASSSDYTDSSSPSYAASLPNASQINADSFFAETAPSCNSGKQILPFSANVQDSAMIKSFSYPKSKGEILIHKPAAIVVKRPPTKIVVNHPNVVVKPAPVIFHKPPPVVIRKVVYKNYPKQVKVEPVYVNVVKSAPTKYYLHERQQKDVSSYAANDSYAAPSNNYDAADNSYTATAEPAADTAAHDLGMIPSSYDNVDYSQAMNSNDNHNGYELVQDGGLSNFQQAAPHYSDLVAPV